MTSTQTTSPAAVIDTARVTGRRELGFKSLDEAVADADGLAAAEEAGRLQRLGNWTLGQSFGHLATWAEFAYTGTPLKPPFIIRLILRTQKNKYLYHPMRSGVKIPNVENGTLGVEKIETAEGLRRYRAVMERMSRECPTKPNVIFGPMTHDEWKNLQLRHSELHLSFFKIA